MNDQQLQQLIIDNLNPEELIEILGLSTEDLCYELNDRIEECKYKFEHLRED